MKSKLLTLTTVSFLSLAASAVAQVANPSFEDPITFDGAPFVGSWEGFSGNAVSSAANSTLNPHTGSQSLMLTIDHTFNTFAGAFQDIAVVAGNDYTFSGWDMTTSNPLDLGVEFRIEWRNSTVEVGRTPNSTPVPLSSYSAFSLTATAPAGATIGRIVYDVQSFSTNPLGNGVVFVDDISFAPVPEPGTIALLSLGGLALIAMRRRQA